MHIVLILQGLESQSHSFALAGTEELSLVQIYIYILPPISVGIKLSNTIECGSGVQKQLHSLGGHSVSS